MDRSPATDVVAALDLPFRFLRERATDYLPTIGVLTAVGVAFSLVQSLVTNAVNQPSMTDPFAAFRSPEVLASMSLAMASGVVSVGASAVCVSRILSNQDGGLGPSLGGLMSPRLWIPLLTAVFLSVVQLACCCYGGSLVALPFGLLLPAAIDERLGLGAIPRSVSVAFQKMGPGFFDRPGWKVLAVNLVGSGAGMALGMVAALPMFVVLGGAYYDAIRSGNMAGMQDSIRDLPVWVTVATTVLSSLARVFPALYITAGSFLIFRDAVARAGGADLERMIAETPRA